MNDSYPRSGYGFDLDKQGPVFASMSVDETRYVTFWKDKKQFRVKKKSQKIENRIALTFQLKAFRVIFQMSYQSIVNFIVYIIILNKNIDSWNLNTSVLQMQTNFESLQECTFPI